MSVVVRHDLECRTVRGVFVAKGGRANVQHYGRLCGHCLVSIHLSSGKIRDGAVM